jgi:serine/threonine protein kinase
MEKRQQQVEEIFHEALQRDPAEREEYLREACRDDSGLRREIASLLAHHKGDPGSESWAAAAAAQLIASPVSLQPGQYLGPYRIESFLAAGGMGEVYRATDTRLNRTVAIKVCAARLSERFKREERVIASLSHPNICTLHDVGPNHLVMEFVEGPTLAERIEQGPVPLEEALAIGRQIADALETAHERGIVHRDLKPGNVKVKSDGTVKVLDFGLAKMADPPKAGERTEDSPTLTLDSAATRTGVILGTAAYMCPEQVRGKQVDKRADIWAFGVVLYEMVTGKRAFHGETTSDILAGVLKEEPEWSRTPAKVRPLLRRCLAKDPKHRLRDIGDAMPLLEAAPEATPPRPPWPWVVAVALLAALFAVLAFVHFREMPPEARGMITSINPPENTSFSVGANPFAISPDGRQIAFRAAGADGKSQLWVRALDSPAARPLPATEGALSYFWSPDSASIAFFDDSSAYPWWGGLF